MRDGEWSLDTSNDAQGLATKGGHQRFTATTQERVREARRAGLAEAPPAGVRRGFLAFIVHWRIHFSGRFHMGRSDIGRRADGG